MPINTFLYRFEQNSVTSNIFKEYFSDLNLLYEKYSYEELNYFDIFPIGMYIKRLVNQLKIRNG
jgi:hypothetical protein